MTVVVLHGGRGLVLLIGRGEGSELGGWMERVRYGTITFLKMGVDKTGKILEAYLLGNSLATHMPL